MVLNLNTALVWRHVCPVTALGLALGWSLGAAAYEVAPPQPHVCKDDDRVGEREVAARQGSASNGRADGPLLKDSSDSDGYL